MVLWHRRIQYALQLFLGKHQKCRQQEQNFHSIRGANKVSSFILTLGDHSGYCDLTGELRGAGWRSFPGGRVSVCVSADYTGCCLSPSWAHWNMLMKTDSLASSEAGSGNFCVLRVGDLGSLIQQSDLA